MGVRPLTSVFVLLAFPSSVAAGTIWHVPGDVPTIQAGIDAASAGDEVVVACGTYLESIVMKSGVTVRSESGSADCVIVDASAVATTVVCNAVVDVEVEGITFTNGEETFGGALGCESSTAAFTSCRFTSSLATHGGGIFTRYSDVEFVDCRVDGNTANEDGSVQCTGGTVAFTDCVVTGNRAGIGGMGLFSSIRATLTRVQIVGNENFETGGGLEIWTGAQVDLIDCSIDGNSAVYGGGIYIEHDAGPVTMQRVSITANTATEWAGGIGVGRGTTVVATDCTIDSNDASTGPDGATADGSHVTLRCCTVDLARWSVLGELIVDDSQCPIPAAPHSWGRLKSFYRP
jgi:hypothetical protein